MEHGVDAAMNDATAARTMTPDESASCSCSTAMSQTATPATTAGTTTDASTVKKAVPCGADRLGIDAEGRIHYWHRAGDQVLVVEPTADLEARIERIDVQPGAAFRGYINHARDVCGWASLAYSEDGIAAALGGDR